MTVGVDTQTPAELHAGGGRRSPREVDRDRRIAAAQDRSRRRVDALRAPAAHRTAGPRSQRHEVPAADAGHAAARVAARREREPAGLDQTQVNGQHFSGTGYQLDGTENRDPILGIIVINPTLESIGEMKMTSQNYDAEFGQATAGVVSMQTKSGSNSFRGSAFEFYQNDAFQSRNPFTQFQPDPVTGKFLPDTSKNQFGGSIGGPIVDEPVVLLQRLPGTARHDQGGSRLLTVPTAAARRGDFSAYGVNIFDPQPARPAVRQQFAEQRRFRQPGCRRRRRRSSGLHSAAQRAGPRERHARQLHRLGLGDVRRARLQRPRRRPAARQPQHVRPLQPRRLHPRRPDRVRERAAARKSVSLGGVSDVAQPQPRLRHRLRRRRAHCWRTSASGSSATTSTCCPSTTAPPRPPTPASPASISTRPSRRACRQG